MAEEHRVKMLEALADYDDELLHRYLESHELPAELIKGAIRKGTLAGRITPVLCGSAYRNRACGCCSTRSSTTSPPRWTCRRWKARTPTRSSRRPGRPERGAVQRRRLQDHDRPVRRAS